jgi:uncharacterized OB-fold protein
MSEQEAFTVEQFYKHIGLGKLLGGKCRKCGKLHLPPRPLCDNCYSSDFEWTEVSGRGKLLTYTVIHVVPAQFQSMAPYAMGIIELEAGVRMLGMIREVKPEEIRIGMSLELDFGTCQAGQSWPQWPRYFFKPC